MLIPHVKLTMITPIAILRNLNNFGGYKNQLDSLKITMTLSSLNGSYLKLRYKYEDLC